MMNDARKINIPPAPDTMEDAIANFEVGAYPPVFQDMYLGSCEFKEYGESVFCRKRTLQLADSLVVKVVVDMGVWGQRPHENFYLRPLMTPLDRL